ncbi:class I SAM-dependent methyltransferase [Nitrogeniibacter mangrovi]|uniref:Class I SAM-dependent methyltransferase n=1 Tax=Nitrogeniibacter mangrovi TaxID=2016596 RepID=A0A6C1AYN7_9RHOO|nr:class I SAM-dependent methyltransferase [Nitrogeniibacter mangrovi]QID16466.1 class I SAM-dependent methyltransferase [Nitrogeniibacter mangrovi]
MSFALTPLVARAAAPYRPRGPFAWHFARGKLACDPIFAGLIQTGLFAAPTRILDLGCGQGLLANWLDAAAHLQPTGALPAHWPAVARFSHYRGIELDLREVRRSAGALPPDARVERGDLRTAAFGRADRVMLLDVLHYMDPDAQVAAIDKARSALDTGGVLMLRVGDADAGWRFRIADLTDRAVLLARGRRPTGLHPRPLAAWIDLLEARGFTVEIAPMSRGTPFANVLLIARATPDRHDARGVLC